MIQLGKIKDKAMQALDGWSERHSEALFQTYERALDRLNPEVARKELDRREEQKTDDSES